jgi:hypothetical protein
MDIAIESVQVEVNASCASVRRVRTLMAYALARKLGVPKLSEPDNGDLKDSWTLLPRDEGCKVSGKEEGGGGVDVASRDVGRVVTLLGGGNASAFCDQDVSLFDTNNSHSHLIDTKNLKFSDLEVQIRTSGSLCTNSTCESECTPRDKDTAAYFLDTYVRISLRSVYLL